MTEETRQKLSKIYALIERGSTEGEKQAARLALDRIIEKHGIDPDQIDDLNKREWKFTYISMMEYELLFRLMVRLSSSCAPRQSRGSKTLRFCIDYLEGVTVECAYEYFRRHMKAEWIRTCAPLVKRCRTPKGANKRRKDLQNLFMARYFIASNLVDPSEIKSTPVKSQAELDRIRAVQSVQGGQYHKQAQSGHLLD